MNPIPYGRQDITDDDIQAVVAALRSDFLTQGPRIPSFEKAFAEYVGSDFAVAVANGTAALHLCALALDVQPESNVIVPSITFSASANCIRYCGGQVTFTDIDPETYTLDIEKTAELLASSPPGTFSGIVAVDFTGQPVDMEELRGLADRYGLWIIEDACHAPGGGFTGSSGGVRKCGDGSLAELAIFSFHPVKHIASGEGGMITTNDPELYRILCDLRTHGIVKDADRMTRNDGGWYHELQSLGYNYRLTDLQAALGESQLQKADERLAIRRAIAARYDEAFEDLGIVRQKRSPRFHHAYHLYVVETDRRKELYDHLREHDIFAQVHYIPTHLMPYYRQFGWKEGDLPVAESYYERCLSLPMYPTLTRREQEYVIEQVMSLLR